ncbi:hypothetical protein GCM10010191_56990 [Actinomadura vinacea]|uniref:WD40 repeat domain-containing protein n=1 Tax=Actinomadura vinacea TaxID=115336 RepID=A0ABN3JMP7_9ACTN
MAGGEGIRLGAPMEGHEGKIDTVAATEIQGRPVAMTAGKGGVVRVWDLTP